MIQSKTNIEVADPAFLGRSQLPTEPVLPALRSFSEGGTVVEGNHELWTTNYS